MPQRTLGKNGLVVFALGLGCMGMSYAYGQKWAGDLHHPDKKYRDRTTSSTGLIVRSNQATAGFTLA